MHIPAKKSKLVWNPIASIISGKYFTTINESVHKSPMHNETFTSLTLSGINSDMTKNGRFNIAIDAIKIIKLNDATGIQLNASTSYCCDLSHMKTENVINPSAVKLVEIANNNCKEKGHRSIANFKMFKSISWFTFRPTRSTSINEHIEPINSIPPTIIAEKFGDRFDLAA